LLMDTDLTAEQRKFASVSRTSGEALLAVINDILDFTKIETGHLDLETQPFELNTCIEEALDLIALRGAEKGLDMAYQMDAQTPPVVIGDINRLRQILLNLLGNAVKFTPQGEVVLSISSRQQADGRHEIMFAVRDTGIGIPPDRLDRLFRS